MSAHLNITVSVIETSFGEEHAVTSSMIFEKPSFDGKDCAEVLSSSAKIMISEIVKRFENRAKATLEIFGKDSLRYEKISGKPISEMAL